METENLCFEGTTENNNSKGFRNLLSVYPNKRATLQVYSNVIVVGSS